MLSNNVTLGVICFDEYVESVEKLHNVELGTNINNFYTLIMTAKKRMSRAILMIVAFSLCWTMETFARKVEVSTAAEFANAVGASGQDGDTVSITSGFTLSGDVTVSKRVTILGNGNTISRSTTNRRITFSADASVENLVLNGSGTNSGSKSFILVDANKKVSMDQNTIVTNASGTSVIVNGTLVGGVFTANKASNTNIVTIATNGNIINTLMYANEVTGSRYTGYGYVVLLNGGRLINATIVDNKLSGSRNNSTSYSYAVTSSSTNSRVINSIVALNTNTQVNGDLNLESDNNLAASQIITSYVGTTDPGFVSVADNNYTLAPGSKCTDKGTNSYNSESKDLAGLDRISGGTIDQGAYEFQSCAHITASKSENLIIGERVVLEVKSVSSEYASLAYEFQWQSSRDGSTWSNIGRDANEARYIVDPVTDEIPYYRVNLVRKGGSRDVICTAYAPVLRFADPYVRFVASGYDRVVTHYAFEVPFGSTLKFGLEAINHAQIIDFQLSEKLLERTNSWSYDASEVENYMYSKVVDDAYEYKLTYKYRIGTETTTKDTTFIVRPLYKCTGKNNEVVWHDDFGTFDKSANDGNGTYQYHAVTGDTVILNYRDGATTRYIRRTGTTQYVSGNQVSYSVPDFRNAVVAHNFISANSFSLNDGYYAVVPTTQDAWPGHTSFGNYFDHTTGDGTGGMLAVNCATNSKDTPIYQRDFSVQCDSSLVIFSAYICNLNTTDKNNSSVLTDANVRLDIFRLVPGGEPEFLQSAYSGDMKSRMHDYDAVDGVDTYWSNLSAKFLANSGETYRIVLFNNRNGGQGNDMMFDDITITACCPDMAISDNPSFVNENQNVEICGSDSSTYSIYAIMRDGTVATDYFVNPYYYLYQYRKKGEMFWKNLVEGDNPYVTDNKYTIDLTTFPSGSECRVILARSTQRIVQILEHYNATLKYPDWNEEQRYPVVNCEEGIYGVAYGYSISYYPDLASLDADKIKVACPDQTFTFEYDPGEVWKERTWLDATKEKVGTGTSFSAKKSSNEIDTYYFVVAGEGGACPDTTTFEARLNHSLAFEEVEDINANAADNCKASVELKSYKPQYSYCAPDEDKVLYSYNVNGGAWVDYADDAKAELADQDTVTWRAILFVKGDAVALDTVTLKQPAHISDKSAPVIDCATLSQAVELPADKEISGDVSFSVSAADIKNASTDNCTESTNLIVNWNNYFGSDLYSFGDGDESVDLNVYTDPRREIIWGVVDEAGNNSAPCIATYEVKRDKYDGTDGPYAVIRDTTICAGDFPFTWYGHTFAKSGETAKVGYALLKVSADDSYFRTLKTTACGLFEFNGVEYENTGVYTVTMENDGACDSVITLDLTILPVFESLEKVAACDSFVWNGNTYKTTGVYTANLAAKNGCDSIAQLDLTIGYSFYDTVTVAVANQYTWSETNETYTRSGRYEHKMTTSDASMCDSIYVLDLTIYEPTRGDTTIYICQKELPFKYTAKFPGVLDAEEKSLVKDTVITYARENMGDSIITFNVNVLKETSADFTTSLCRAEFPYTFDAARNLVVYEPQSDTAFVIENRAGCDSTINLHIDILEASPITFVKETSCDSYFYRGEKFTKDTAFVVTLQNVAGCDSVVDVQLTINHTLFTIENLGEVCDSVEWHGNWYYETNNIATYTASSNVTGCDSIVTLNVVVNHSVKNTDRLHLCTSQFDAEGKFAAPQWGKVFELPATIPAVFTDTFKTTTVKGCDSIVALSIVVDNSIDIHDTVFAKDSYTWPVTGLEYTASGVYNVDPTTNALGCDSSASLVLRIIPTKTAEKYDTACVKYAYRYGTEERTTEEDANWNFRYDYDTTFTFDNGKKVTVKGDSMLTLHVKVNKPKLVVIPTPFVVCNDTVWNGISITKPGQYEYITQSTVTGCDSTTKAIFRVRYTNVIDTTVVVCDEFTWNKNGVKYTASAIDAVHVPYSDGKCDSIIYNLNLTVNKSSEGDVNVSLPQSELANYSVEGHKGFVPEAVKKEDGSVVALTLTPEESAKNSFLSRIKNSAFCDSTVNVHITLLQSSDTTKLNDNICRADLPYALTVDGVNYHVYGDTTVMTKNKIGGDSIVTLALTINEASTYTEKVDICGLSYEWNGKTYTESTTDVYHTLNAAGCDSTVNLYLTLRKPTYLVEDHSVCDSMLWNGVWYKESHIATAELIEKTFKVAIGDETGETLPYYVEPKPNQAGCDSVVILNLTVTKTVYGDLKYETSCDAFQWLSNDDHLDGKYTESGRYEARTTSHLSNCDSVAYLDLTILKSTYLDTVLKVCENKPMVFDGKSIEGDTTFVIANAAGCDSIINVTVQTFPVYDTTVSIVTCDTVVEWLGEIYTATGSYTKTLKTKACDCDSVVTLNLTINPSPVVNLTETACGRYELNGKYYTESGIVKDTFTSVHGCDSIVIVDLTVTKMELVAPDTVKVLAGEDCKSEVNLDQMKPTLNFCDPTAAADYSYSMDSLVWSVVTPNGTATVENGDTIYWRVDLSDQVGKLDSVVMKQIVSVVDSTEPQFLEDCSAWVSVYKVTDTITGNVSFTLGTEAILSKVKDNCSDNASLDVQWDINGAGYVSVKKDSTFTLNAYKGDSVSISWKVVDASGNESAICEKVYEIDRDTTGEDGEKYSIIRDTVVCSNEMPFSWHGATFNNDGDTAHVGTTLLNVHVDKSFFVTDTVVACDSYVWRDGVTYTASNNTAIFNAANAGSCDSVYTLNLTILNSTKLDTVMTVCESQLPIALGGSTISSDSTFTLVNAAGCDSVVTVKLNVVPTLRDTATEVACGSYVWNNQTLSVSGTYSDTLTSAAGCDSIATLNLTIALPAYDTIVAKNVCHAYEMNGVVYNQTGIYNDTLQTLFGCDSIVTLDLTLAPVVYDTVAMRIYCGSLVWNGKEYSETGLYNDTLVSATYGCDSIVTLNLVNEPRVFNIELTTCQGLAAVYKGVQFTQDTTFVVPDENDGCDVVYNVTLHVTPAFAGDTVKVVACESYDWNGITFTESGLYSDTVTSITGCDSVAFLQLTISLPDTIVINDTILAGSSYSRYGYSIENAAYGVYNYDTTIVAASGCDTLIQFTVTAMGRAIVIDSVLVSGGEPGYGDDNNGNGGNGNGGNGNGGNGDNGNGDNGNGGNGNGGNGNGSSDPKVIVNGGLWFCSGDYANVKLYASGAPSQVSLTYDSLTTAAGFVPVNSTLESDGSVQFFIPENTKPGSYVAYLQLFGEGMSSDVVKVKFNVSLNGNIIKRKWNDVVVCNNSDSMFVAYQWYKNNEKIDGATGQYYNDLTGVEGTYSLDVVTIKGDTLHVCGKDFEMLMPEFSITAYPVPAIANEELTIQVIGLSKDQLSRAKLVVYSIDGTVMYRDFDGLYEKNVLTLPIGDYVAVVTVDNGLSANCKILVRP